MCWVFAIKQSVSGWGAQQQQLPGVHAGYPGLVDPFSLVLSPPKG